MSLKLEQPSDPTSSNEKSDFFGKDYWEGPESNYKTPVTHEGYKSFDKDGFWEDTIKTIEEYSTDKDLPYLDLGCAYGYLIKRMPFKHKVGVDISRHALNVAKEESPYEQYAQIDAEDPLPFDNDTFGCVTALDVIEHTFNAGKTIKEISRVTKPGGVIAIGLPINDTFEGKIWTEKLDVDESHHSILSREELFKFCEDAGLEILKFTHYYPTPWKKIPFPRTNVEVITRKCDKTAEELRATHIDRFKKKFLKDN